mmetsp:Transcript_82/g.218  ORF Transcript_82/g.218 Transcript_82/m.218 type:complete len:264 (-) Transcript_82:311-1102(-)
MGLVDLIWLLRFHDVQLLRECLEMLRQRFPARNLAELFILVKVVSKALSRDEVRHLLGSGSISARLENSFDTLRIVDFQCYPQSIRILLEFHVKLESHIQHHQPFHVRGCKHRLRNDIRANFCDRVGVSQRDNVIDQFHLQEQINRINFCMVLHVEWHDFPHQLFQVVASCFLLLATFPILSNDLATEVAHILLPPRSQALLGPLQSVFQGFPLLCFGHTGTEDRQHIRKEPLRCSWGHRIVMLAEFAVMRPQKLQRLRNRSH